MASEVPSSSGDEFQAQEEVKAAGRSCLFLIAEALIQSKLFFCLMSILTVFVLVGDDIRLAAFEADADFVFDAVTVAALSLFAIEIVVSSWVKDDYFLGFWFALDTIATVSLVFDLTYVSEALISEPEISIENVESASDDGGVVGQSEYARASRSSRVGARIARLIRVVRLIRLSRVLKHFNRLSIFFLPGSQSSPVAPGESAPIEEELSGAESRVGKKLSEKTTQRVFILVLVMLFGTPMLNPGNHFMLLPTSAQYGADVIYKAWADYQRSVTEQPDDPQRHVLLRRQWETELLMYIYYHNHHADCPDNVKDEQECAESLNNKLCFVGYVMNPKAGPDAMDNTGEGYIRELRPNMSQWNSIFSRGDWRQSRYVVGTIPESIQEPLTRPWETECSEASAQIYGMSLLSDVPCPRKTFRSMETMWYVPGIANNDFFNQYMQGQIVFVFDIRKRISWQARMSMVQTFFIVLVLGIAAFLFSKDTDNLVLFPIERMIRKVETIRKDPLYAIKLGDQRLQQGTKELPSRSESPRKHKVNGRKRSLSRRGAEDVMPVKKATMETLILENAIIKLGSLLALGFGEAGSEIIGKNLDDDNSSVEVMIPGSKVEAIYGFCDIRHFTTVTEVLQEKTMVFVNQVAEIAHRIVDDHLGAANKNLGEAFLLVWRIGRYAHQLRSKIADLAVMSFVQVVAELSRDGQLAEYREHPALLARLPNFRVSLGFGLHLGWSIEGAIGSDFKIDASYLSPHVNIATLLQAETQEYGVTMLMSEPLVRFCNPAFRRNFRPIDHVKFQGSTAAMRLFTVDLNCEALSVDMDLRHQRKLDAKSRYHQKQMREKTKLAKLDNDFQVHQAFDADKNIKKMRERCASDFFQEFEKGYMNYEAGEWNVAGEVLSATRQMLSDGVRIAEDGPSRILVEYMAARGFQAPPDWAGYRELVQRGVSTKRHVESVVKRASMMTLS
jgi:class 3 adenylate cyclase